MRVGDGGICPVYDDDDDRGRRSGARFPNPKPGQGPHITSPHGKRGASIPPILGATVQRCRARPPMASAPCPGETGPEPGPGLGLGLGFLLSCGHTGVLPNPSLSTLPPCVPSPSHASRLDAIAPRYRFIAHMFSYALRRSFGSPRKYQGGLSYLSEDDRQSGWN